MFRDILEEAGDPVVLGEQRAASQYVTPGLLTLLCTNLRDRALVYMGLHQPLQGAEHHTILDYSGR